jgi:hypothetical protein
MTGLAPDHAAPVNPTIVELPEGAARIPARIEDRSLRRKLAQEGVHVGHGRRRAGSRKRVGRAIRHRIPLIKPSNYDDSYQKTIGINLILKMQHICMMCILRYLVYSKNSSSQIFQ